jgi:hypothetical protein
MRPPPIARICVYFARNSIPDYVPVDGFLAMIEAAKKIRMDEAGP